MLATIVKHKKIQYTYQLWNRKETKDKENDLSYELCNY